MYTVTRSDVPTQVYWDCYKTTTGLSPSQNHGVIKGTANHRADAFMSVFDILINYWIGTVVTWFTVRAHSVGSMARNPHSRQIVT